MTQSKIKVRILRGVPGSGKSCFGRKVLPKHLNAEPVICSADSYFIDKDGNYRFNPKKLGAAHKSCKTAFLDAVLLGNKLVIVDNTNIKEVEIAYYYNLATTVTQDVEILTIMPPSALNDADWIQQCVDANQHGVPISVISRMWDNLKRCKLSPSWRSKIVIRQDGYFVLDGNNLSYSQL